MNSNLTPWLPIILSLTWTVLRAVWVFLEKSHRLDPYYALIARVCLAIASIGNLNFRDLLPALINNFRGSLRHFSLLSDSHSATSSTMPIIELINFQDIKLEDGNSGLQEASETYNNMLYSSSSSPASKVVQVPATPSSKSLRQDIAATNFAEDGTREEVVIRSAA